jgi:predicted short-subunit dehydrogenase-like oxidoreductase (DUF2520 family)
MPQRRTTKPRVAIVGAGNLGTALALSLGEAGYAVTEVVARGTPGSRRRAQMLARKIGGQVVITEKDEISAKVVWICVPDREIRNCAETLAAIGNWRGKIVFHASGALGSGELGALRKRGAAIASVHPLMTFVRGVVPTLTGVPFAVEGDVAAVRMARRMVRDLGGQSFAIRGDRKAAYHAWGSFASPLLVALLVTTERVAGEAGVSRAEARRRMLPIIRQTLANYAERGPDRSFSGPIIRGDGSTLEKHLRLLRKLPDARHVYLALARSALRSLPVKNREQLGKVLGRTRSGR